jgi:hypothetical protein
VGMWRRLPSSRRKLPRNQSLIQIAVHSRRSSSESDTSFVARATAKIACGRLLTKKLTTRLFYQSERIDSCAQRQANGTSDTV